MASALLQSAEWHSQSDDCLMAKKWQFSILLLNAIKCHSSERQRTTAIDFVFLLAARHSANKFALCPRSAVSVRCHLKHLLDLKATTGCTTSLDLNKKEDRKHRIKCN